MNIKDFLIKTLGLSVTLVKRVKYGGVFINGENVHMRAAVKWGDTVEVRISESPNDFIKPMEIPLEIIYEDEYLLAVNKPTNMPTHPSRGNTLPTLANAVLAHMGEDFVFRAVNRLDKNTSGIVLIAKDAVTSAKLGSMMKKHEFGKKYVAVLKGVPKSKSGTVSAPIEREREGSIKRCVREDGKDAVTEYEVLRSLGDEASLCEFRPKTGRTHQIRVHAAYIGHPLLGDEMYGGGEGEYMLHCKEMTLTHPITGEVLVLRSDKNFDLEKG
ncbi:MAG: RluA family pseudouridine synthase [Clostridia bacterium]|nr:RluA family pseudouridine synthase [Clostridia bacterium]